MENSNEYPNSKLTGKIINAAYYVYNYLGFGFLESVYEKSLEIKLLEMGFNVSRQKPIKVYFEGEIVGDFKADLIVNDTVILELKAVESIHPRHEVQLINLSCGLAGWQVGILAFSSEFGIIHPCC